jgi:hypothetical protein
MSGLQLCGHQPYLVEGPGQQGGALQEPDRGRSAADATEQLGKMAQRTMQLQCTIQDGQIWLTDGTTTVEIAREVLKSER